MSWRICVRNMMWIHPQKMKMPKKLCWVILACGCLAHGAAVYAEEPQTAASAEQQYNKRLKQAASESKATATKCKHMEHRSELKTHAQFARCVNQGIDLAYQRA